MMPKWHFLLGLIVSSVLYLFGFSLLEASLFFSASFFLIDLDHVPRFILKERSINPISFYRWSCERKVKWLKLSQKEKSKYKKPIFFFHNIETLIILFFITIFYPLVLLILLGFLFHITTDLIYQHFCKEEKQYKMSLIYTLVKNKYKKEFKGQGL